MSTGKEKRTQEREESKTYPKDTLYVDTDGTRRLNGLYCPDCFGDLEKVFPLGSRGLRETPDDCMYLCAHKTPCLKAAMAGERGFVVREEMVERNEKKGVVGFLGRWAHKKKLHNDKAKHR